MVYKYFFDLTQNKMLVLKVQNSKNVTNNIHHFFTPTETVLVYERGDTVEEGNGHHLYLSRAKAAPKLSDKQ